MTDLTITGTPNTPEIEFLANGNLHISGRAIPEDSISFFEPLFKWCEQLVVNELIIHVNLDYINTSSTKQLMSLFKTLTKKEEIGPITIKWKYEEDDEDMLEAIEYFQESIESIKFEYITCADD
ncbi:DUF1987 domain-containing protein [Bacteroidales bacterium]|nr:DUF1987 domain-containing protein [Bacteroidales bacterium]